MMAMMMMMDSFVSHDETVIEISRLDMQNSVALVFKGEPLTEYYYFLRATLNAQKAIGCKFLRVINTC